MSIVGCVEIQPAASRLTIMRGPSVKMGAAAVSTPALSPPERVSLITIVRSGPGFTPSTAPRMAPASANDPMR